MKLCNHVPPCKWASRHHRVIYNHLYIRVHCMTISLIFSGTLFLEVYLYTNSIYAESINSKCDVRFCYF